MYGNPGLLALESDIQEIFIMINFHPRKGAVLICNFSQGFKPPEIVKARPVVVVTPQLKGRANLCTVVPLSSVEPIPIRAFHHEMSAESLTPRSGKQDAGLNVTCSIPFLWPGWTGYVKAGRAVNGFM